MSFSNNRLYSQKMITAGDELTITYINLMRGTLERNEQLRHQWKFSCSCPRCLDPTELETYIGALKCPYCSEGNHPVPIYTDGLSLKDYRII